MVEGRTRIPETGTPKSIVIDFQAARHQRLSEGRQGGAAQRQNETPHQERRQEPIVAASTAATPFSVPAEQSHLPHEPKDTLIDLEAVRRKLREEQGKRQGTGTASEQNAASDPHMGEIPIVFGTNFAGEAQERYGYTGGAFLHHLSLGEGDTNGLLCTCARDSTKPPRLTVFSSTGAVVRPSACGGHHAGSGREQAVVL